MRKEPPAASDEQKEENPAEDAGQEVKAQEIETAAPTLAQQDETEILRVWRDENDKIWLEMDNQRLESREDLDADQRKRLLGMLLYLRPWLEPVSPSAPEQPAQAAAVPAPVAPEPVKAGTKTKTTPPVAAPAVSLKSMVEQIDDVLQEKLAGSPFEKLNIKLLEGPGGDVVVQIGSIHHTGIGAIPNPQIQEFIHAAVAEWERRSR